MTDLHTPANSASVAFVDSSKISYNIVCKGFKMKDVIVQVLNDNTYIDCGNIVIIGGIEDVANKIQAAFAIKMGLRQG